MTRAIMMWVLAGATVLAACNKKANETTGPGSAGSAAPTGSGSGSGSGSAASGSGSGSGSAVDHAALLARGQYVAAVTACVVCHTPIGPGGPDRTKAYAGGLEVPEKFGTWRSPNITPSKSSGIGSWTDDQILAAIREGVRPDGAKLYPVMPYMNYNRMTDADGKALVAYLRTLPAIDNVVAPNKLPIPQPSAPKPANAPDDATDPIAHGEYLSTLMHCSACHTPFKKDGSPDLAKMFAGGFEMNLPMLGKGTLIASNITPDPDTGIGKWTEEQLAQSLKTMVRPNGKMIVGPMMIYQALWSQLDDKDLHAVAAFFKKVPAVKHAVPASTFVMNGMK